MTLDEIINDLKYSELKQLGIAKQLSSTSDVTKTAAEREILVHLNLALTELYKRFDLRTEETVITLVEGQTLYTLSTANVYNDPANLSGYLSAFTDKFNHVLGAYDEEGKEYRLNDENDALAIFTPSYNSVQVPNPIAGEAVYIVYSAAPDTVAWADDLTSIDIPLPPAMKEALLHYIGYRGHTGKDGSVDKENNTHYMRFEASCNRLLSLGMFTNDAIHGHTLSNKGFV